MPATTWIQRNTSCIHALTLGSITLLVVWVGSLPDRRRTTLHRTPIERSDELAGCQHVDVGRGAGGKVRRWSASASARPTSPHRPRTGGCSGCPTCAEPTWFCTSFRRRSL